MAAVSVEVVLLVQRCGVVWKSEILADRRRDFEVLAGLVRDSVSASVGLWAGGGSSRMQAKARSQAGSEMGLASLGPKRPPRRWVVDPAR